MASGLERWPIAKWIGSISQLLQFRICASFARFKNENAQPSNLFLVSNLPNETTNKIGAEKKAQETKQNDAKQDITFCNNFSN